MKNIMLCMVLIIPCYNIQASQPAQSSYAPTDAPKKRGSVHFETDCPVKSIHFDTDRFPIETDRFLLDKEACKNLLRQFIQSRRPTKSAPEVEQSVIKRMIILEERIGTDVKQWRLAFKELTIQMAQRNATTKDSSNPGTQPSIPTPIE